MKLYNLIPMVGVPCFGIFVGYIACYCLRRYQDYSNKTLSGFIAAIVTGGGVFSGSTIAFTGADKILFWLYPIGLLFGLVLYILMSFLGSNGDGTSKTIFQGKLDDNIGKYLDRIEQRVAKKPDKPD